MNSVFVVQHLHILPDDEEDVKMIGVYASRAEAIEATNRLSRQPGFCENSQISDSGGEGFHIDEYEVGKDGWEEGFVTIWSG